MKPLLFASFTLMVLFVSSSVARADDKRVLVFRLTGEVPGAPASALDRLTQVVARSAGLTGAEVTTGKVTYEDTAAMAGCSSPDAECLGQVAQALHVDHVVFGRVEPDADGKNVTIALTAFVDGQVTQKEFVIPVGPVDGMVAKLAQEVPALFVGARPEEPKKEPPPEEPKKEPPPQVVVPPPPPPRESGFSGARVSTYSWFVAGGGALVAGTGAVFLVLASGKQGDVDSAPIGTVDDFHHLQELEDQGESYTQIGNVLLIGGGAALLAGAALVVYQGYAGEAPSERSRVSLRPMLAPGGAGLTLELSLP